MFAGLGKNDHELNLRAKLFKTFVSEDQSFLLEAFQSILVKLSAFFNQAQLKKTTTGYGREVDSLDLDMLAMVDIVLELLDLKSERVNEMVVASGVIDVLMVVSDDSRDYSADASGAPSSTLSSAR